MEPSIQYAKTSDGVSIAHIVLGEGPWLVYASNIWGDVHWYAHNDATRKSVDALVASGWRVVRYDGRGMGSSDRDVTDFSVDARLRDLQAVIDHVGVESFVLYGYGQGGPVAITYGLRYPECVSHLVLANSFASGATYYEKVPAMRALLGLRSMAQEQWEFFTLTLASAVTGFTDTARATKTADLFRSSMSPNAFLSFVEAAEEIDVTDLLPLLKVPTLVVQDTAGFVTHDLSRVMASRIPGARFVVTDDAVRAIDEYLREGGLVPAPASETASPMARPGLPSGTGATMRVPSGSVHTFAAGRYTVTRLLGEGAQKIVYLVHDAALERDCALALLKTEVLDADGLARVRREGQAMARLAHPNIVTVHDIGEEDGRPYLVCEYVPGGDLRHELDRAGGSLPLKRALAIAEDLCCALAFAHSQGIIHRDVKPSNVHVARDGSAKLGDFGLALAADRSRLTMAGTAMGTAAYMAPEQARGQPVDARSDLYSLGCLLYELVTGRPPFTGDDPMTVVSQHVHAVPEPPSQHNAEVSRDLEQLVLALLAKAREERPSSAEEVLAALRGLEEAQAAPAPAARPRLSTARRGSASPRIRYVTTADGIRIAYATLGEGPPFVFMPDPPWFHVQLNWQLPELRRFFEQLARNMTLVRYDARGHGLSQRDVDDYSLEAYLLDLEALVDHLDLQRFVLFGIGASVPVAITYAARLPERVSHLILWGFARGADLAGSPQVRSLSRLAGGDWELFTESVAHVALGWEAGEPARRFAAVARECVSQEAAAKALAASMRFDVTDLLGGVTTPTLVLHPRQGKMLPVEASEELAGRMPNAHLVLFEGESNAVYIGEERAREFVEAVEEFVGAREAR